jgi:hypothetical protein
MEPENHANPAPPPDSAPFLPHYVDSTMMSTWRSCKRKHFHTTILGLQPPGRNIHLVAGGAFAAGIEHARKAAFAGAEHIDDQLHAAYPAFRREWGPDTPFFEGEGKSYTNTFASLEEYLRTYPILSDEIQPLRNSDGTPTVEFTFAIPLDPAAGWPVHPDGGPFSYVGRFDMLGNWWNGTDSLPCILDEKTTSGLGPFWLQQWAMRGQFMGYCWALQQLGYPVRHCFVRGVALLKTKTTFLTAPVSYSQFLLSRWEQQLRHDLAEMAAAFTVAREQDFNAEALAALYGYSFADACSSYGGCAYTSICGASVPERWYSAFEYRRWDPLHKGAA